LTQKYTKEYVTSIIHEKNPLINIIGEYVDTHTKVMARCNTCNNEWMALPQRLMRGHNCPVCALKNRRLNHLGKDYKTTDDFKHEMENINPNIEILSEYKNARTKVKYRCKVCGLEHEAKPPNLLTGCGCPRCGNKSKSDKQIKTNSQFISELQNINPNITPLSEYKGNKTNILLQCDKCGNQWYAMPINLLRNDSKATGCPHCLKSHGEQFISNWLDKHNIEYKQWKTFDGLVGVGGKKLSYDFFIPKSNKLIEYQGEYHDNSARLQTESGFVKQKEHDLRKSNYAKCHGFDLLEIWYFDNKEEKLKEFFNTA
jgi:glutaredoxin